VVIEDTDVFSMADWSTFRTTFGLSAYTSASFTQLHPAPPSGPNNCASPGAFAPNSAAEATHGIGTNAFASTPYNVAVGDTDFSDTFAGTNNIYWSSTNTATFGSALPYIPEIPWNDSCAGELLSSYLGFSPTYGANSLCNDPFYGPFFQTTVGGGSPSGCATGTPSIDGVVSGTCQGWPKPSWQSVLGNPTSRRSSIRRLTPAKAIHYQLAANEYGGSGNVACNSSNGNGVASTCIFYDVTQGDIDVNRTGSNNCYNPSGPSTEGVPSTSNSSFPPAYGTTIGWDFATGIGTLNAANLAILQGTTRSQHRRPV
jgi:hypothetical protein